MPVPTPRGMVGQGRETDMRLTLLERRLASAGIPERLGPNGQEVLDWNDATAAGFYWGYGAANHPASPTDYPGTNHTWWVGQVQVFPHETGARIKQMVTRPNYPEGWEFARYSTDGGATWGAWKNIGFTEPWTDLRGYLASGVSYKADGASSLAGIRARRVGPMVEMSLGNFVIAGPTSIPVSGNIANTSILQSIPAKFRPAAGVGTSPGWNGVMWSGFVHPNGEVLVAAVVPSAAQTGTLNWVNTQLSGSAFYPAAD